MKRTKKTYGEWLEILKEKEYQAPNHWMRIADELKLADQYKNLKTYEAPNDLWDTIEKELPSQAISKKYNSLWLAGALVLAILLGGLYMMDNPANSNDESPDATYTSEVIIASNEIYEESSIEDDALPALSFIKSNKFLFSEEVIQTYEEQLDELEVSKQDILKIQEMYGADAKTMKMLAKIEREKATLIKSMIKGA